MSAADAPPEPKPDAEQETSFHERALGGPPNPLENIDHLFHHTSKRLWLGIVGAAILLAAGVIWTAVATEVTTDQAQAVIVSRIGLFSAVALRSGLITSLVVGNNSFVAKGQPLAYVAATGSKRPQVGVRSPIAGKVIAVDARVGDLAQPGAEIFLIEPTGQPPMAIALFPAARISEIALGQKAEVAVNGVAPAAYGFAIGHVVAISPIPVSSARLEQLTGDSSLVGLESQLGPLREIDIGLQHVNTPSGLAWTEGNGPPARLPIGVRAVVSITTGRETLIHEAFG